MLLWLLLQVVWLHNYADVYWTFSDIKKCDMNNKYYAGIFDRMHCFVQIFTLLELFHILQWNFYFFFFF